MLDGGGGEGRGDLFQHNVYTCMLSKKIYFFSFKLLKGQSQGSKWFCRSIRVNQYVLYVCYRFQEFSNRK
jgi:hypothetical protein